MSTPNRHQRLLGALMLAAATAAIGTACASIMGVDEEPQLITTVRNDAAGGGDGAGGNGGEGGACLGANCACTIDKDCADPTLTKCVNGLCRACAILPKDTCPSGSYCSETEQFICTPGCKNDQECSELTIFDFCVPTRHQCVACREGRPADCAGVSQVCSPSGSCVDRCNDAGLCPNGNTCCNGLCVDTSSDIFNCKECGVRCPTTVVNAVTVCTAGVCDYTACNAGFGDCDLNRKNGCECVPCGQVNGNCCPQNPKCLGNAVCGFQNKCRSCKPAGSGCDGDHECCSDSCNYNGGSSRRCQ